jgi:polysaccharide transporter, PST family
LLAHGQTAKTLPAPTLRLRSPAIPRSILHWQSAMFSLDDTPRKPTAIPAKLFEMARGALLSRWMGDLGALTALQASQFLLPLLLTPYLTRVLGPLSWGQLTMAQGTAFLVASVVDYGFGYHLIRESARNAAHPARLAVIWAGAIAAKLMLLAIALPVFALAAALVPSLHEIFPLLALTVPVQLLASFHPMWLLQGVRDLKFVVAANVVSKICALTAVFIFVRGPEGTLLTAALLLAADLAAFAAGLWRASRWVPIFALDRRAGIEALAQARHLFVYKIAGAVFVQGNVLWLGLLASPREVAFYAGAEKIIRAAFAMFNPAINLLYIKLSGLANHDPVRMRRLCGLQATMLTAAAAALGLALFFGAEPAVVLLLGHEMAPATDVLRVLAALPVATALNFAFGNNWLLPTGRDRLFTRICIAGAAAHLLLVAILVPRFHQTGMAATLLTTESLIAITLTSLFISDRRAPRPCAQPEARP